MYLLFNYFVHFSFSVERQTVFALIVQHYIIRVGTSANLNWTPAFVYLSLT